MVAVLAEFEQDRQRERVAGPLSSSPGRPKGLTVEALAKAKAAKTLYVKKNKTVRQISRLLGVGRATIYRYFHYLGITPLKENEKDSPSDQPAAGKPAATK